MRYPSVQSIKPQPAVRLLQFVVAIIDWALILESTWKCEGCQRGDTDMVVIDGWKWEKDCIRYLRRQRRFILIDTVSERLTKDEVPLPARTKRKRMHCAYERVPSWLRIFFLCHKPLFCCSYCSERKQPAANNSLWWLQTNHQLYKPWIIHSVTSAQFKSKTCLWRCIFNTADKETLVEGAAGSRQLPRGLGFEFLLSLWLWAYVYQWVMNC